MNAREYEIVQNVGLAAVSLWSFVDGFVRATERRRGPTIAHTFPVLPIAFHEDSSKALGRRQLETGFYTALTEHRDLFVGLQKRMQDMAPQTFRGINLACGSKLLDYDRDTGEFHTIRRTRPFDVDDEAVKRIWSTSRRLGHWFAVIPVEELGRLLQLRF